MNDKPFSSWISEATVFVQAIFFADEDLGTSQMGFDRAALVNNRRDDECASRMGTEFIFYLRRRTERHWLFYHYSHSIVPGGFDVMSYVTRLIPRHSLMMRLATRPKNACSKG